MVPARRHDRWARPALAAVILGAAALSATWVVRVPVFQAPDEPLHLDYALGLHAHGGLFRADEFRPFPVRNGYENVYTRDYVHPHTNHLLTATGAGGIAFSPAAKVTPDYGSAAYFERLDQGVPPAGAVRVGRVPYLFGLYPCGYYALLACWLEALRQVRDRPVFLFFGARLLSVVLLVFTLFLVYRTVRLLPASRRFSLALTAAVGFFPLTSFVSSYVQPDNLALTLVSLCFYLALRARREPGRPALFVLLGLALGALLVTKLHYYLAVAAPVLALLAGELWFAPGTRRGRAVAVVGLLLPSLAAGLLYASTVGSLSSVAHPRPAPADWVAHIAHWTPRACRDYYFGTTHRSFWGVFGWLDAPLIFHDETTTRIVRALVQLTTLSLVALTLRRLAQVGRGLARLVGRGHLRLAWRVTFSNPVLNSYFLFTALMLVLYVRLSNSFGGQGRNWLPFVLPAFLTAAVYAPRAIRQPHRRAACAAAVLAGLFTYDAVGSYYALRSIDQRYYTPFHGRLVQEVPLALKGGPVISDGGEPEVLLPGTEFVYGVRLDYVLTNPDMDRAVCRVAWDRGTGVRVGEALFNVSPGAQRRQLTVWVNDAIDRVRIRPDLKPCHFEVHAVTLLKKPTEDSRAEK